MDTGDYGEIDEKRKAHEGCLKDIAFLCRDEIKKLQGTTFAFSGGELSAYRMVLCKIENHFDYLKQKDKS